MLYSQGAFSGKSKSLCSLDRIGAGTRDPKHSPHPARDGSAPEHDVGGTRRPAVLGLDRLQAFEEAADSR